MLYPSVLCAALALVFATIALLVVGPRLRQVETSLSIVTAMALATLSWWVEARLAGPAAPIVPTLAVAIIVTGAVATVQRSWNPVGPAAFSSVLVATALFLLYAGDAI